MGHTNTIILLQLSRGWVSVHIHHYFDTCAVQWRFKTSLCNVSQKCNIDYNYRRSKEEQHYKGTEVLTEICRKNFFTPTVSVLLLLLLLLYCNICAILCAIVHQPATLLSVTTEVHHSTYHHFHHNKKSILYITTFKLLLLSFVLQNIFPKCLPKAIIQRQK